jgi:hypothetical protein
MGEDVWRQTRERIAESTLRVNYFIGTVRMICGKEFERGTRKFPPFAWRRMGHPADFAGGLGVTNCEHFGPNHGPSSKTVLGPATSRRPGAETNGERESWRAKA